MKNLLIRYITIISLFSLFAITWSNTLTLNDKELATKLQIETNLSEKVSKVICKVYPVNQFAVTSNISLLSVDFFVTQFFISSVLTIILCLF